MAALNPFGRPRGVYTPEQARAAIATAQANPILSKLTVNNSGFGNQRIDLIPGYHVGNVDIEDQADKPENPGRKKVTSSAYGMTIPLSNGRRKLPGVLIQSGDLVPLLIGGREYDITYKLPIYEDKTVIDGAHVTDDTDGTTRPRTGGTACPEGTPCDPKDAGGGGDEPSDSPFIVVTPIEAECSPTSAATSPAFATLGEATTYGAGLGGDLYCVYQDGALVSSGGG